MNKRLSSKFILYISQSHITLVPDLEMRSALVVYRCLSVRE